MPDIRVEYISFEEIETWPRNPKDHDLNEIKSSFHRFGFIKPVLVDEGTGRLVAGHGRLETLSAIKRTSKNPPQGIKVVDGQWLVPVLRGVAFKDEREAEAFLIADNRLGEIGGWDEDLLSNILEDMMGVGGGIEGVGFTSDEIAKMIEEPLAKEATPKNPTGSVYTIMITCKDEEEQSNLLERFMAEGLKCQGLLQ